MGIHGRDYMRAPSDASEGTGRSVTLGLVVANAVAWFVYAGALSAGGESGGLYLFVTERLLLHPLDVLEHLRVWQPFTALFFDDPTNLAPLLLTVLLLWLLGRPAEDRLGAGRFLALYLGAGVASMTVLVGAAALGADARVAAGALGALWGVAGFLAVRAPRLPVTLLFFQVPVWALVAVLLGGTELLRLTNEGLHPTLFAHLAAAGLGVLAGRLFPLGGPRPGPGLLARLLRRRRAAPPFRPTSPSEEAARLDAVLAKISAGGTASLSESERAFLEEASRRRVTPP